MPQNFEFVIGKDGKVLDIFPNGEHEMKAIFVPQCVKRFRLDKQQKDGSFLTSFSADAYFVNLNMFEYEKWKTYRKIEMYDQKYGYYNFSLQGGFAFKVTNAKKFMTALLKVYDYLKNFEASAILQGFVVEFVIKFFEKNNFQYDQIKNLDFITDQLYNSITNQFEDIGVSIEGLIVNKIKFSGGFEKRIQSLMMQENLLAEIPAQEPLSNISSFSPKQTVTKQFYQTIVNNNVIEENNENKNNDNNNYADDEIVDLEQVSAYNNDNNNVRCVCCGAKNSSENKVCHLCGELLTKRN